MVAVSSDASDRVLGARNETTIKRHGAIHDLLCEVILEDGHQVRNPRSKDVETSGLHSATKAILQKFPRGKLYATNDFVNNRDKPEAIDCMHLGQHIWRTSPQRNDL